LSLPTQRDIADLETQLRALKEQELRMRITIAEACGISELGPPEPDKLEAHVRDTVLKWRNHLQPESVRLVASLRDLTPEAVRVVRLKNVWASYARDIERDFENRVRWWDQLLGEGS
jgi:hypothetical protein